MQTYHLSVVTPEGTMFEDDVSSMIALGSDGFFGVLANHAPMVARLTEGVLEIKKENETYFFAIGSGVLEVAQAQRCLLLTNFAQKAESAEAAKQMVHENREQITSQAQ